VNGFLLILGHFAYPFVYDGRPFADVLASATTVTAATAATAATITRIRRRTDR
jgi:hypothetical protein